MKHFTFDERLQIQRALTLGQSFTKIAEMTGKDRTSISREIRAHLRYDKKPARSRCKYRHECIFDDPAQCPAPTCNKRVCSKACAQCAQYCDKYEPEVCPIDTAGKINCFSTKDYHYKSAQTRHTDCACDTATQCVNIVL